MNNPYTAPTADIVDMESDATYEPKMFAVDGRIGRLRYLAYSWGATLLLYLAFMVLGIIAAIALPAMLRGGGAGPGMGLIVLLLLLVYVPIFAIVFIYAKRRLNDLDQSGWLGLLFLVPIINLLLALYLIFAPGTDGANRYGPAPAKNSGIIVWVVVIAFVLFGLIGVLAAVSIPAYQDYVRRAHEAQIHQQEQQQSQPQSQ